MLFFVILLRVMVPLVELLVKGVIQRLEFRRQDACAVLNYKQSGMERNLIAW